MELKTKKSYKHSLIFERTIFGAENTFGIDCSGFTQMVYKLNGYKLLRDASQQSSQGEALSFIEEPGDLAF
jgi:cell wall-associated NlpC family hydrolase